MWRLLDENRGWCDSQSFDPLITTSLRLLFKFFTPCTNVPNKTTHTPDLRGLTSSLHLSTTSRSPVLTSSSGYRYNNTRPESEDRAYKDGLTALGTTILPHGVPYGFLGDPLNPGLPVWENWYLYLLTKSTKPIISPIVVQFLSRHSKLEKQTNKLNSLSYRLTNSWTWSLTLHLSLIPE